MSRSKAPAVAVFALFAATAVAVAQPPPDPPPATPPQSPAKTAAEPAPESPAEAPAETPPQPLPETPSRLESDPHGWTDVMPGPDLAGWTRQPWPMASTAGPQQWSLDAATKTLVCDGTGGHDWIRLDREIGDGVLHVEWRFVPVEGEAKYNSGVLVRTAADQSVWHQAQVGGARSGYLFARTPVGGTVQRVNLSDHVTGFRVRELGEWNVYEITAKGPQISLWVNGAVTSEMTVDVLRGHFGLEGEGYRIEFRKLMLKVEE